VKLAIVYVSGPYTKGGKATASEMRENYEIATNHSLALWQIGFGVMNPMGNTHWDLIYKEAGIPHGVSYSQLILFDLRVISRLADCVFMIPNWESSKGAKIEHNLAELEQKPIFYSMAEAQAFIKEWERSTS